MICEDRKGNQLVPWTPKRFSPNGDMIRNVVRIGIPDALITVLMSVSNIVLNNYIAIYGSDAVASYGIAYQPLASIFLQDDVLIEQTGYLLKILCLSAPMLGIVNMMTRYFQALGKAVKSLPITLLRNAVLFIPGIMILNCFGKLNGVIAAQPVVDTALAGICILMYISDIPSAHR